MTVNDNSVIFERLVRLEGVVRQQGDQLGDQGGAVDHLVNTMDTIILPMQATLTVKVENQQKVLDAHAAVTAEAHDYIVSQKGAWALIQRAGIVIAAIASVVTMALKLAGK